MPKEGSTGWKSWDSFQSSKSSKGRLKEREGTESAREKEGYTLRVTLSSTKWIVKSHISRGKRVKVETATMWPVQVSDEMDKWEQWLWRLDLSHHGVPIEWSTGMVPAFCMTRMFFLLCAEPQPWTFSPFFWGILWKEVHFADARSSHWLMGTMRVWGKNS